MNSVPILTLISVPAMTAIEAGDEKTSKPQWVKT